MKKLITLCLFAFTMLFAYNGFAQDKVQMNKIAHENAKKLASQVKINKEQREKAYQAFKSYQEHTLEATGENHNIHPDRKRVIEEKLQKEFAEFLTPDQFEQFLVIFEKEKLIQL